MTTTGGVTGYAANNSGEKSRVEGTAFTSERAAQAAHHLTTGSEETLVGFTGAASDRGNAIGAEPDTSAPSQLLPYASRLAALEAELRAELDAIVARGQAEFQVELDHADGQIRDQRLRRQS